MKKPQAMAPAKTSKQRPTQPTLTQPAGAFSYTGGLADALSRSSIEIERLHILLSKAHESHKRRLEQLRKLARGLDPVRDLRPSWRIPVGLHVSLSTLGVAIVTLCAYRLRFAIADAVPAIRAADLDVAWWPIIDLSLICALLGVGMSSYFFARFVRWHFHEASTVKKRIMRVSRFLCDVSAAGSAVIAVHVLIGWTEATSWLLTALAVALLRAWNHRTPEWATADSIDSEIDQFLREDAVPLSAVSGGQLDES